MSVQYTAIFHGCKNDNFQMKCFDIFLIFAQNIDCGYMLEPPQRGSSNEYPQSMFSSKNKKKVYPCEPQFYYIKVGCKGVFVARTCFHDETKVLISCMVAVQLICAVVLAIAKSRFSNDTVQIQTFTGPSLCPCVL